MPFYAGGRLAFTLKSMVDLLWIRSDHQRSACTKAGTVQRRFSCLCSRMAGKPIEWSSFSRWCVRKPRIEPNDPQEPCVTPIFHDTHARGKRAVSVGRDGAHIRSEVSIHPANNALGKLLRCALSKRHHQPAGPPSNCSWSFQIDTDLIGFPEWLHLRGF